MDSSFIYSVWVGSAGVVLIFSSGICPLKPLIFNYMPDFMFDFFEDSVWGGTKRQSVCACVPREPINVVLAVCVGTFSKVYCCISFSSSKVLVWLNHYFTVRAHGDAYSPIFMFLICCWIDSTASVRRASIWCEEAKWGHISHFDSIYILWDKTEALWQCVKL